MSKQKKSQKMIPWLEAKKRHHLSDMHVQMARELGMNPKKLGKLDNHKQEPWKLPLPQFIEKCYLRSFKRPRPEKIVSLSGARNAAASTPNKERDGDPAGRQGSARTGSGRDGRPTGRRGQPVLAPPAGRGDSSVRTAREFFLDSQVFLFTDRIRLPGPLDEFPIKVGQRRDAEMVNVIARRDRVDAGEPRVLEPAGQHEMADEMSPAHRDGRKRHSHLKRDPCLFRQNDHWADTAHQFHECIKELARLCRLSLEMGIEAVVAAKVRLIAVGEPAATRRTLP